MSQQIINISTPDDGLGDVLRNGFDKVNQNTTELYNSKVDKVTGKGLSENDFTDADKSKLDGIEAGAQVNVNADFGENDPFAPGYILNKPPAMYASVGYFDYNDIATHMVPLVLVSGVEKKLTNDTLGVFTNLGEAPYGVPNIWVQSVNQFDFSTLSIGDTLEMRVDCLLTTTGTNKTYKILLKLGIGTASEFTTLVGSGELKSAVTDEQIIKEISFYIGSDDVRDAPAELYILVDTTGSVKVNGWYTRIIRKGLNVVEIIGGGWGTITGTLSDQTDLQTALNSKLDKVTSSGVERAYIINADGSQSTKPTSELASDKLDKDISTYTPATTPLNPIDKAIVFQRGVPKEVAVSEFVGDLQSVTDNGNSTTNEIVAGNFVTAGSGNFAGIILNDGDLNQIAGISSLATISKPRSYNLPDKSGIIATLDDIPSNPITGTGTTNRISKFTAGGTIGDSQIFDDGTNVGIGTTSLGAKLDVNGSVKATSFIKSGGTPTQFLMANGSVTIYGTTAGTVAEGSHTHTFASITSKPTTLSGYGITDGIRLDDTIQNTNPFGGRKLYINTIDNVLAGADKKYWVTVTKHKKIYNSVNYPKPINSGYITLPQWEDSPIIATYDGAQLFNNNYEDNITCESDEYLKVALDFSADKTAYFNNYPYGTYYLSYYNTSTPDKAEVRCYNGFSTHTIGYKTGTFTDFINNNSSSAYIQQYTDTGNYQRRNIEFIIYGHPSHPTSLTQIEWKLQRPDFNKHSSFVSNFTSNKLYQLLKLGDQTIDKIILNPNGTITADTIGIGTTSPQARLDVRAQGALETNTVFRVRNSTDTINFLVVNGAGDVYNNGAGGVNTNTFFGENVGRNTTGINNTAIGRSALFGNTTGTSNTALGQAALLLNTTGINNTAIGRDAGRRITDGSNQTITNNSIFIGPDTRALNNNETNQIVIGYNATGQGSNSVVLGNTSITKTQLRGQVIMGAFDSAPTGIEGAIYYDSEKKKHYGFDGITWNVLY